MFILKGRSKRATRWHVLRTEKHWNEIRYYKYNRNWFLDVTTATATRTSKEKSLAKQSLCTCIALFFFYISLQSLHDFHLKLISFMFYGQREQFSFSTRIFLFILYLTLPYSYCDTGKELNFTKRKEKQSGNYFLNKYFLLFLHFRTYSLTN